MEELLKLTCGFFRVHLHHLILRLRARNVREVKNYTPFILFLVRNVGSFDTNNVVLCEKELLVLFLTQRCRSLI